MRAGRFVAAGLLYLALSSAPVLIPSRVRAQSPSCSGDIPEVYPIAIATVQFDRQFTGTYRPGEPKDVLTVLADGSGETLAQAGIHIRVRVWCSMLGTPQQPIEGLQADRILLWGPGLCAGAALQADHATDANGDTEFSGALAAGGCAPYLSVFIDGALASAPIPVRTNSPDADGRPPCTADASDLATIATRLGVPSNYDICSDFDESGCIDASDLSYFATAFDVSARTMLAPSPAMQSQAKRSPTRE